MTNWFTLNLFRIDSVSGSVDSVAMVMNDSDSTMGAGVEINDNKEDRMRQMRISSGGGVGGTAQFSIVQQPLHDCSQEKTSG